MIIIVSKKRFPININDCQIINNNIQMLDEYHLLNNEQIIEFDYLIIEALDLIKDLDKTNILLDDGIPVTNWFRETSLEHIYYGDVNCCLENLLERE